MAGSAPPQDGPDAAAPPPPPLRQAPPGTCIATHPAFGAVLVAQRAFAPGEVVISEPALLCTEEASDEADQVDKQHRAWGIHAPIDGREGALDFGMQARRMRVSAAMFSCSALTQLTPDPPRCRSPVPVPSQLQLLAYSRAPQHVRDVVATMFRPCTLSCPDRGVSERGRTWRGSHLTSLATRPHRGPAWGLPCCGTHLARWPAPRSCHPLSPKRQSQYIDAINSYVEQLGRHAPGAAGSVAEPHCPASPAAPEHPPSVLAPCAAMCATPEGRRAAAAVLLVFACNAYAWADGGCALLPAGSLVTHSCCENTRCGGRAAPACMGRNPLTPHHLHRACPACAEPGGATKVGARGKSWYSRSWACFAGTEWTRSLMTRGRRRRRRRSKRTAQGAQRALRAGALAARARLLPAAPLGRAATPPARRAACLWPCAASSRAKC